MKTNNVLIVGCGDLGARAGGLLLREDFTVTGLRRDISRLPSGFAGLAADYTVQEGGVAQLEALAPDFIIITPKPAGSGEAGYRRGFTDTVTNLLAGLGNHRPAGIIMVSSTRVLAGTDGAWVDETSPLVTDDPSALAIIAAEQLLLESPHPTCIVRCTGIYGDPEGSLLRRIAGGELCAETPLRYSNRIHRDDVGGLLAWLVSRWRSGSAPPTVMIGVDDEPAPQFEVEQWLARQLGVSDWRQRPADARAGSNKRCRNLALHASGYRLRYPDYRSGYSAVLRER
ncbi:hypothetical protein CWI75_03730 [Kineobactrum sediminis]|uniref:Epimerase n=1 Tax=Kineobactrum sediminis TaxID=1905677 RepID=A0A2N5Y4Z5_9GAMM|nr:hypothetical protein [Kineobactrum sediminis]PLW83476.1 hypothetical protein CWI75_03730 [Kineobactrum sediminis]